MMFVLLIPTSLGAGTANICVAAQKELEYSANLLMPLSV